MKNEIAEDKKCRDKLILDADNLKNTIKNHLMMPIYSYYVFPGYKNLDFKDEYR